MSSSRFTQALQSPRLAPVVAALRSLQAAAHRHPKRVSAAVLALLAGSAMTAFGVAPMSVLPEPALPVVTQITEPVSVDTLDQQLASLDSHALPLYRSDVTRQADSVDSLLRRLGVDDAEAAQFIRNDPVASTLLQGRVGKSVKATVDNGRLQELIVRGPGDTSADIDTHFTRITIERTRGTGTSGFTARKELLQLERLPQMASGTIQSSLYAAADDARLPEGVTNQIAEMFGNDIDFRRELRKGDAFSVLYETNLADGEPVTWGNSGGMSLQVR